MGTAPLQIERSSRCSTALAAAGDECGKTIFGPIWTTALDYCDPQSRLDFSDTGALLHILGRGELRIREFGERFLRSGKAKEGSRV
jgi:hypothetical protein